MENHSGSTPESLFCTYRIDGIDCHDCSVTLKRELARIPGIIDAELDHSTGLLNLEYSREESRRKAKDTVKKMGYRIETAGGGKILSFYVPQLDCSEEVKAIKKAVSGIKEIINISFYPLDRTVKFELSDVNFNPDLLIKLISDLGMTPELSGEEQAGRTEKIDKPLFLSVIISGIFLLTAFILSRIYGPGPNVNLLLFLAMASGGWNTFYRGILSLKNLNFDINILVTFAVAGAIYLSELNEGAVVVFLFSLAQLLENISIGKSRRAIKELMEKAPRKARVIINSKIETLDSGLVRPGQRILVNANERIPLDGVVEEGATSVDESAITGESIPRDKVKDSRVYAGTVNLHGTVTVEVTEYYKDTRIARIIKTVEEAQASKAPSQAFIEKFASIYTPAVIIISILLTAVPVLFMQADFARMFYRSMVLLLIACPCALVISTPVAVVSALSAAASRGVLIKGGIHLENLASINSIAFDKTGTLTQGKPSVSEILTIDEEDPEKILSLAASLESASEHPLARAIVKKAEEDNVPILKVDEFQSVTGKGARGIIEGEKYFIGRHRSLTSNCIECPVKMERIACLEQKGYTVAVLTDSRRILGAIAISDKLKGSAEEALTDLKKLGITEILMLSGDNDITAGNFARQLKIPYKAELLPDDKVKVIKEWKESGKKVAMVGDGVNDAPALSLSDTGIAMGTSGTDVALEVADVVLMTGDLSKIPYAVKLAEKTLETIKTNIALSVGIKALFLITGLMGIATLWMAVFADMGASLMVILLSLRLLKFSKSADIK